MKNIKKSSIMYLIVFFCIIVFPGILSFRNLINFYVNDEVDYNEWTVELGDKFETDVATTFYKKNFFINMNGAYRNILSQHEMNGVIKLNNGYLCTSFEYVDNNLLEKYASHLSWFNEYLKSKNIKMLYSIAPYTSSKYDLELPNGIIDYGNDNIDRLVNSIKKKEIDVIDFREQIQKDGYNQYDLMYKTDHHWTTEAGLYAYGVIEDWIVQKTGCKVEDKISDISNYNVDTYKNWHLGSRGQRTGKYFAGIDDFNLLVPKFPTLIEDDYNNKGNMPDLVYNMEPLKKRDDNSRYTYDFVLGKSCSHYKNLRCDNDIKILIIGDSFSKAVCPFLMLGFSEIMFYENEDVSKITPKIIENYNPDVVVLLYYPENGLKSGGYAFDIFNNKILS